MSERDMKDALKEARDLIDSMRDVSADGRRLAKQLAESINEITDMQCGAIEARIDDLSRRLTQLDKKR